MAKMAQWTIGCISAALAFAVPAPLRADGAPPAAAVADPVYDAQKAAFDALPEADRRAIQDAMVWSGRYVGVVDGVFGKRTRDSIVAYQASLKIPANGLIDAAQAAAMASGAQKARAAVRFQTFADARTGMKIGAPLKILEKRIAGEGGGVRLTNGDGSITLELSSALGDEARLGAMFAALTAEAPGRRITLKISRPDFFVVSGEEAGRKFYQRAVKAPPSWPDPSAIRGFRIAYPAAQSAELDRIVVAVADSFEPFPASAAPAGSGPLAASPGPAPGPTPAPMRVATLAATGLIVAPGQALSAIGPAECPNPSIDGKPAKFIRDDREAGLSLLAGEFAPGLSVRPPSFGAIGPDLVALSFATEEPGGRIVLDVAAASPLASSAPDRPALLASLSRNAGGAPVFDRAGGLVAVIAQSPEDPKRVAGVAPVAPHGAIDGDRIRRFLSLPSDAPAAAGDRRLGAGQIAAAERPFVVAVSCLQ
ncbi:MAG: peptidoglycan-binding domain-containing protein [Roseiarcus sp.]